jgi:hypothetical protein
MRLEMHARSNTFGDEVGRTAPEQIHATRGAKGEIAGDQWEVLLDDMA